SFIKPFRMFGHVGMIGRTVDREIEGNFQSQFTRFLFQPGKILQCAQSGIDVLVPSAIGTTEMPVTNRIRHSRIIRPRVDRIVSSFAIGGADWMDRWK